MVVEHAMTFPIAMLLMGALFWPATVVVASLFVVLAFVVRAGWARVLCFTVAVLLAIDALGGAGLLAEWERSAVTPPG